MKNAFCLILTLVLVFSLAACGNIQSASGSAVRSEPDARADAEPSSSSDAVDTGTSGSETTDAVVGIHPHAHCFFSGRI